MSRYYELLQRAKNDGLTPRFSLAPEIMPPPMRPANRQSPREATDVFRFLRVLQQQWRVVAGCTVAVFAIVVIATLWMKPIYEPVARLEVDPPGDEAFALDAPHIAANDTEYVQTQVENLQSDELGVAVIRRLHLARDPSPQASSSGFDSPAPDLTRLTPGEDRALREFKSRLKVENDPGSQVIKVSVSSHDASAAARITNTLVALYVQRMAEARSQAIQQSVAWLSGQLQDIHKRMNDSNRQLAVFESANGIADVGEGKSTFGDLLEELDKQRSQTAAQRIELQALLNKEDEGNVGALPQVHDSRVVQQLTESLAQARAELAQSSAIYGPHHPKTKRLQDQVNELQEQLQLEERSILAEVKKEYAAAQAQEGLMNGEVKDAMKRLALIAQYNLLKREAETNANLYNNLYSKINDAEISAASKSSNVRVVDQARILDHPTYPRRALNAALGLVGGLVLGTVVAFAFEGLQSKIRTAEDIQQCNHRLPVSILPMIEVDHPDRNHAGSRLLQKLNGRREIKGYEALLLSRPRSAEAEAVRGLRASLMFPCSDVRPPQALLVASSLPGEGKTTVAMNLAVAFSQEGPTCVIDCDLYNSAMSRYFTRSSERGLAEVLAADCAPAEAIFDTHVANLSVMPAGKTRTFTHDLITRGGMKDVLEALRSRFTFILFDSPPILPYVDGRLISTMVDGIVFVGRTRVTTRGAMLRALQLLDGVNSAPVLEVVLNAAESDSADYRYYRYAYK